MFTKVCQVRLLLQIVASNFVASTVIRKVNIEYLERVIKKFIRNFFTHTIVLTATVELMIAILLLLSNVEHTCYWKNKETFGIIEKSNTYINVAT